MIAELALDIFCFVCGTVIVYRSGENVDMMRWQSNHLMRVAYWAMSVGGAALVFSAVASEAWLRPMGWSCVVAGVTLLCVFDRRRAPGGRDVERREPTGHLGA